MSTYTAYVLLSRKSKIELNLLRREVYECSAELAEQERILKTQHDVLQNTHRVCDEIAMLDFSSAHRMKNQYVYAQEQVAQQQLIMIEQARVVLMGKVESSQQKMRLLEKSNHRVDQLRRGVLLEQEKRDAVALPVVNLYSRKVEG